MKKILMLCLSLTVGVAAVFALPKGVDSPRCLLKSDKGLMAPVWSPSGDKIAVTTDNFAGIFVADRNGTNLRTITTEAGTGYKMAWTADGSQIIGRTNVVEKSLVLHELKSFDVASGKSSTLVTKSRFDGTPAPSQTKALKSTRALKAVSVYEQMLNNPSGVAANVAGLRSLSGKVVINPALSADGSKIAFQIAGKGIFVCDANGGNLVNIGTAALHGSIVIVLCIALSLKHRKHTVVSIGTVYPISFNIFFLRRIPIQSDITLHIGYFHIADTLRSSMIHQIFHNNIVSVCHQCILVSGGIPCFKFNI